MSMCRPKWDSARSSAATAEASCLSANSERPPEPTPGEVKREILAPGGQPGDTRPAGVSKLTKTIDPVQRLTQIPKAVRLPGDAQAGSLMTAKPTASVRPAARQGTRSRSVHAWGA